MSNKVDFAGVFRAALPKAYISSVELLPTNIAGARNGVSYDEESNDVLETNEYGKRRPRRGRQRFDDATGQPKGLQVKAEITIRDIVRQDGNPTWFNNPSMLDSLKINVVLARGSRAIERLQDGGFTPKVLKTLKRNNKIMQKVLSVRKDGESIATQKQDMIDNRNVYCVTYEVVFEIPNYNPRNLSLFASTFINLHEYRLEKTPQIRGRREVLQGIVDSQNIIKAGSVPVRASVALLPDDKVWAGPVHFHEGTGLMAGAFHSELPHPILTQQEVPNLVVKDYRSLESVKEAELLLKPYTKRRRKKLQNKSAQGNRIIKKDVYVSEPEYAFNEVNEVRFLFHVDFFKIIAEKTQFGSCFVNADPRAKRFMMNNTRISDITVTRNRVRRGLSRNENILVDYEDRNETVAQSRQRRGPRIAPRRLTRAINPALEDSEEVTIGGIREIELDDNVGEGLRTFTVSDFEMARKTDGKYCYSVSISLQDGTIAFAQRQRKRLLRAIDQFKRYHQMARKHGNFDQSTGQFSRRFVERMERRFPVPTNEQLTGNRRERRQAVQSSIASAPWLNAVATYADSVRSMTNVEEEDLVRAVLLMESLVSPTSGTVMGIETVLQIMEDFEGKISSTVVSSGTNEVMVDEVDFNARTSAFKGKAPRTLIEVNKKFKKIHDSNMQNSVGYDFLNVRRRNNVGLRVLSTTQLSNRLFLENQKYFNQNPLEEEERSRRKGDKTESLAARDFTKYINLQDAYYSYLTPAQIMFGNQRLRMLRKGRKLWNTKQYNTMISSLAASTTVRDNLKDLSAKVAPEINEPEFVSVVPPVAFDATYKPTVAKIDTEDLQINVANSVFSSTLGVSIVSPATHALAVKQENIFLGSENNQDDEDVFGIDPKTILGENSNFATEKLELLDLEIDETVEDTSEQKDDYSSVSNIFINASLGAEGDNLSIDNRKELGVSFLDPTNERNIIDKRLENFNKTENAEAKKQQFMSRIPNQIKSILLGADRKTNKNWFDIVESEGADLVKSPSYTGLKYFNYSHMNVIEVLVGFEQNRFGNTEILNPIYKRLTKQRYDGIVSSGKTFICRMRPYRFEMFKKSRKLKLPEYNLNFLLIARDTERELVGDNPDTGDEPEIVQETDDTLGPTTEEERSVANRLVEYTNLNSTGRQMLRLLIRRSTLLGDIMPEFTNTVYMQQPKTISRVGTSFASGRRSREEGGTSQVTRQAAGRRPTPRNGRAMTRGTRSMRRPRGSSGGGGGTRGGY